MKEEKNMSKQIVQGQYVLVHMQDGSQAYINAEFDGDEVKLTSKVVHPLPPEPVEEPRLTILCPFCNAPYTATMEAEFNYSMGSEWTGIYGEEKHVKIFCDNCKKVVYTKDEEL